MVGVSNYTIYEHSSAFTLLKDLTVKKEIKETKVQLVQLVKQESKVVKVCNDLIPIMLKFGNKNLIIID